LSNTNPLGGALALRKRLDERIILLRGGRANKSCLYPPHFIQVPSQESECSRICVKGASTFFELTDI